jgi:glycosyltransferase involved in cell wall biosynthesis
LRALADLFALPDHEIGWFLPALRGALSLVREHQPDVIFSSSPPHSSHLIAVALKRLTGLPVVLDFRDPWARPQWQIAGTNAIRARVQGRLERWCVERADRVILNTSHLRDEFVETYRGEQPYKFVVIPNGYDPEVVDSVEQLRVATKATGTNGVVRLCHPGMIYGPRDLRPLIAAVGRLSCSDRRIILDQIGSVEDSEQALHYAEQLGVQASIVLHGRLTHAETLRYVAAADIFVLSHPGTSLTVPCKLFEMLPFRKPVVALGEPGGATAQIIERYGLGVVVSPGDDHAIAQAVVGFADGHANCPLEDGWQQAMRAFDGRAHVGELGSLFDTFAARSPGESVPPCPLPEN